MSAYLRRIDDVDNPRLRSWLRLSVSSALRPSSRWLPGSLKPQVQKDRIPPDVAHNLLRSPRALARDSRLEQTSNELAAALRATSQVLPIADGSIDAVITSPPYGWMYDYIDVHRLSYLAFGWSMHRGELIGWRYGISHDGYRFEPPWQWRDGTKATFVGSKPTKAAL